MSLQSTKNELVNLLGQQLKPKEFEEFLIILSFNGKYKVEDILLYKKDRWEVTTLSETEAKELAKNPEAILIHFQVAKKTDPEPEWIKEFSSLFVPIDITQVEILNNFFNCEFTPMKFESPDKEREWYMTSNERKLWKGVREIWEAKLKGLAVEIRGSH